MPIAPKLPKGIRNAEFVSERALLAAILAEMQETNRRLTRLTMLVALEAAKLDDSAAGELDSPGEGADPVDGPNPTMAP